MTIPINPAVIDIFLQPGEVYFGDCGTRIRTVLGSCVSLTFWHPQRRLGGMCHFMLPERGGAAVDGARDGRYAGEALELLFDEMRTAGTAPHEYQVKLFGGGRMFDTGHGGRALDIGGRNIDRARLLLRSRGLALVAEHLAGVGHRSIVFEVATGDVWVRHMPELARIGRVA